MLVKTEGWPRVLVNDSGIRPLAGKPDECFYCKRKVGEEHGRECVCVLKIVRYDVLASGEEVGIPNGIKLGTFEREDPYFWDEWACSFHKNESSWCTNNALSSIKWLDTKDVQLMRTFLTFLEDHCETYCTCNLLKFQYVGVVNVGPLVEIEELKEDEEE